MILTPLGLTMTAAFVGTVGLAALGHAKGAARCAAVVSLVAWTVILTGAPLLR